MFIVPLTPIASVSERAQQQSLPFSTPQLPFQGALEQAMEDYRSAEKLTKQDAYQLAIGDAGDLHTIAINSAMQQTALEATVQITSRAVSAYKEIMQMQV